MKLTLKKFLTLTGALIAFAVVSMASPASPNATFGFVPIGTVTVSPGNDLLSATSITLPSFELVNTLPPTAFSQPNDFVGLFGLGDTVTLAPLTLSLSGSIAPVANLLEFTTGLGNRFTFSATTEQLSFTPATRSVALYFLGVFHDNSSVFSDAPASLTLSFNQSAANTTINGSGTFSTPPQPFTGAPEPASMALMGSALIGIGLISRKRFVR